MYLFGEDRLKAVAYYRHSAEDKQENSVEIQRDLVRQFAFKGGVEILEEFQDEGFTGMTADRPGFQALFEKYVRTSSSPEIDYVIVYDASRFGRFQSRPEAWRLLVQLDERGIKLGTVNRGLPKTESTVMDDLILILDFAQAGEFSKLLSDKVFHGCVKVSEQGYSAGGTAPYGYVRVLLSESRERVGVLQAGEHKAISNQRVIFEPSTSNEARTVARIFHDFVDRNRFPEEIAHSLNKARIPTAKGGIWTPSGIMRILSNETYIGTRVYNKTWSRLKQQHRKNPREEWVRCPNAHKAIVDSDTFQKAQERLAWLRPRYGARSTLHMRKILEYVHRFLDEATNDFTSDQKLYIQDHFPVVTGSTYAVGDMERVCFYLPANMHRFDTTLLCAVSVTELGATLTAIYSVKREEFTGSHYLLMNTTDRKPLLASTLSLLVSEISNQIIAQQAPWLLETQSVYPEAAPALEIVV